MAQAARWAGRVVPCRGAHWRRVADLAWSCRGVRSAVSRVVLCAPCRRTPVRALSPHPRARLVAAPPCVLPCVSQLPTPYRGASCVVSWRFPRRCRACLVIQPNGQASLLSRYKRLYHDTPQRPSRSLVTIQLIVSRHTPPARPFARALLHALARGRLCRGPSWPCRGLSRPYRGRPNMHRSPVSWLGAPTVSRYNALYRDSGWENGQ